MSSARRLGVARAFVDGRFVSGDVGIIDGAVDAVGLQPTGRGGSAVAGFVDLQVNGVADIAATLAIALRSARAGNHQAFGTRWAIYPSTTRDEVDLRAAPDAVIDRDNLTDILVARALRNRS